MQTKRTGYVWHELYGWHDTGNYAGLLPPGGFIQPGITFENPETKTRFASLVEVSGFINYLERITPTAATVDDLMRVHSRDHIERIQTESLTGGGDAGDGISPVGRGSYEVALLAAGGTISAARAVTEGIVRNAYALVRPPGHHALPDSGMGYCIFANIAIAIEWVRAHTQYRRFAVVDLDVHHGNGTETIYREDADVLTISIHQDRLFPQNSGLITQTDQAAINIPLPAGCGNGAYASAMTRVVLPALERHSPDMIFVAAGFDASANDPLGRMSVTARGFFDVASSLVAAADKLCEGRLVMSHEGGYSAPYVPFCGLAVLEALAGESSGVQDPFEPIWGPSPQHAVQPWQTDTIAAAAEAAGL
ncbi:class II histone deacetylase [Rhodococcus globerulus]|uniref:Class II histone deacetylase n=1 Tax=Rhodococcus globerulus TaxID=33008 RepID=A0ABU4C2T4_RHOGO|nr:class II histone deacetylase [Rhodococcus globerulus]MDV6270797.1 class II histone deacetylase [Rhodococcus globerulus]